MKLPIVTLGIASTTLIALTFTPTELTAITIATGGVVAIVFTGIVNIIVALRTERKVDDVKVHVNSAASASVAKIEAMQAQIDQLTQSLSKSERSAALLAQSAAMTPKLVVGQDALVDELQTNTRLTQEIRDVVVPSPPETPK